MTYAVRNLLPARSSGPLAFITEAVLIHVDDTLSALLGQCSHSLGAITKLFECSGPITVDNDIGVGYELLKLLPSSLGLQIKVGGVLAHVAIYLEERHVGQIGASDLQYVGAILG